MTDARVLVMVDNLTQIELEPIWAEIRREYRDGDLGAAKGVARGLERKGAEGAWLGELVERAITIGRLDRLDLFGLSKTDIICYFDPADFGLVESWDALLAQHLAVKRDRDRGDRRPVLSLKDWLRAEKGATVGTNKVTQAARRTPSLHPDFERLSPGSWSSASGP
jgi:hypothetical protein